MSRKLRPKGSATPCCECNKKVDNLCTGGGKLNYVGGCTFNIEYPKLKGQTTRKCKDFRRKDEN